MVAFEGLLTALVTPFRDGALDEAAFRALVRRQIENGVDGLVPVGTTGEAPTLPIAEHVQVVRWTIEEAAGEVPVLAGIGSNDTATAVDTARRVEELGAQGVLATAPYYNKPTQEGLYRHFSAIAAATPLEVCLYDVPGRTAVRILPATVERLSEIENVTGLKDATGDLANAVQVHRRCGERITLFSGDDFTALPFLYVGGSGVISVASNVVPETMKELVTAAREGRLTDARVLNERLFPLFEALFLETSPGPVKAALHALGLLENELRLPLVPVSDETRQRMLNVLRELGLT
ncbi:MAG: 4-hydroxy-tetrahydrodipicolinate synthase [Xanthomonadales bacterium]|nr:4-hydroxy-tetrahydrodipicolinate synthase [Xanthomonadales bacterium]NIX11706.1 4-hydroxy-tetrahydrodipicolinate synthase [Xanthomonadales bacterium]